MMKAILLVLVVVLTACAPAAEIPAGDSPGDEHMINEDAFTLADIAAHASEDDCWMAMDGKVYDVTPFIAEHPGGAALLEGCGIDATTLYNTRPMGSGSPHSDRARSLLDDYEIGILAS